MPYNLWILHNSLDISFDSLNIIWNSGSAFIVKFFFLTNWYSLFTMDLSIISWSLSIIKALTTWFVIIISISNFTTNSLLETILFSSLVETNEYRDTVLPFQQSDVFSVLGYRVRGPLQHQPSSKHPHLQII